MIPPNRETIDFAHPESYLLEVPANLWRGLEAVGGKLTVTSERLIFVPHAFNLQSSPVEVPLGQIAEIRKMNSLKVIPNRMDVVLVSGDRQVFVLAGRNRTFDLVTRLLEERRTR